MVRYDHKGSLNFQDCFIVFFLNRFLCFFILSTQLYLKLHSLEIIYYSSKTCVRSCARVRVFKREWEREREREGKKAKKRKRKGMVCLVIEIIVHFPTMSEVRARISKIIFQGKQADLTNTLEVFVVLRLSTLEIDSVTRVQILLLFAFHINRLPYQGREPSLPNYFLIIVFPVGISPKGNVVCFV